jgi:hypothetical protein
MVDTQSRSNTSSAKHMKRLTLPSLSLASSLWILVPLVLSPSLHPAYAYLDPGTGSFAIQMAIGVIFGASYTFRTFISRTIKKIKNRHSNNQD